MTSQFIQKFMDCLRKIQLSGLAMVACLMIGATVASADSFYVASDGANIAPYDSWENAATSLNDAVYVAVGCGGENEILVKVGTYSVFSSMAINGAGLDLTISGGYAGEGLTKSSDKTIVTSVNSTIFAVDDGIAFTISGLSFENCTFPTGDGLQGGIISAKNKSKIAVVECTVSGASFSSAKSISGGLIAAVLSDLTIRDSFFEDNEFTNTGDNVTVYGCCVSVSGDRTFQPMLDITGSVFSKNCLFKRARGVTAGNVIYANTTKQISISDSTFQTNGITYYSNNNNGKGTYGAAIYSNNSNRPNQTFVVDNCLFEGNYICSSSKTITGNADVKGTDIFLTTAGLAMYSDSNLTIDARIRNSIFIASNEREDSDLTVGFSAINLQPVKQSDISTLSIDNCLFAKGHGHIIEANKGIVHLNNVTVAETRKQGSAIYAVGGTINARNSIFWNNEGADYALAVGGTGSATFNHCFLQNEQSGANNRVGVDPLFVDGVYYHVKSQAGAYSGGWFAGGIYEPSDVTSPAIDAGEPMASYQNEPQPNGTLANIGYDANTEVASKTVLDPERPLIDDDQLQVVACDSENHTVDGADLVAQVVSTGNGVNPQVVVVWDYSDKGMTSVDAWMHSRVVAEFGSEDSARWNSIRETITGASGTVYYRFVASNDKGTSWSNVKQFGLASPPELGEVATESVYRQIAKVNGELISNGGVNVVLSIKYWLKGEDESTATELQYPSPITSYPFDFCFDLSGLTAGANYQYKVLATTSAGVDVKSGEIVMLGAEPLEFYVTPEGAGDESGLSWENAMSDLQFAINQCNCEGDRIYLKSGEYAKGVPFATSEDANSFVVNQAAGLTIVGGFEGIGAPGAQSGETILTRDLAFNNRVLKVVCSRVTLESLTIANGFVAGDGAGCYASGSELTITNCVFRQNGVGQSDVARGGGAICAKGNSEKMLVIRNSKFVGNSTGNGAQSSSGGAISADGSVTITDSLFDQNIAYGNYHGSCGGALSLSSAQYFRVQISNSTFLTNSIVWNSPSSVSSKDFMGYHARICAVGSASFNVSIEDCQFIGGCVQGVSNDPHAYHGSALYFTSSSGHRATASFKNCLITNVGHQDEVANMAARGIYYDKDVELNLNNVVVGNAWRNLKNTGNLIEGAGSLDAENVTIAGAYNGYGIYQNGKVVTIRNSILWGNDLGALGGTTENVIANYNDIENVEEYDGLIGGNNKSEDPLFVDHLYYHLYSQGGYYLGFMKDGEWSTEKLARFDREIHSSGAIDAGDPASEYENEPRRNGKRINLGAYGNTSVASKQYVNPPMIFILR